MKERFLREENQRSVVHSRIMPHFFIELILSIIRMLQKNSRNIYIEREWGYRSHSFRRKNEHKQVFKCVLRPPQDYLYESQDE